MSAQDLTLAVLVVVIAAGVFYMLDPTLGGLLKKKRETFANYEPAPFPFSSPSTNLPTEFPNPGPVDRKIVMNNPANVTANDAIKEHFANPVTPSPMPFAEAEKKENCYPKNQLAPQELLPNDPNSKWAQVNPMGSGDIAGKNFLNAGALIGVNTVGQSLRNASWDLRSEPPNPQLQVSPWMQSTIEPELQRRPLEIA